MPDPKRLLRTLEQAGLAFHQTPGRQGHLIHIGSGAEVLVAGDLHGNLENFRLLLAKAELAGNPSRHLILQELIHGPHRYPTGGDKSHQLLDVVAALKCQFPNQVHVLLGNHELSQWTGQAIAKADAELNDLFREGVGMAYGSDASMIYGAYLRLFAVLPLAVRTANRIFLSHSLPSGSKLGKFDPACLQRDEHADWDLRPGGSVHSLVWGRDVRAATAAEYLKKVDADLLITGHIPCDRGFDVPNDRQLILDSLGAPACYCLFQTTSPLTHRELIERVVALE